MGILEQLKALFRQNAPASDTAALPAQLAAERRRKQRVDAREGTRVLIIDDSKTIVTVLQKFLSSAGYETLEAFDAETGLTVLQAEQPELIFLDIMLPGMNGFAALRAIRRDPRTRATPVIMMSGNEEAMEQFFGARIGADDFMKKPFSRQEVFFRIERLLDDERIPRRALRTSDAHSIANPGA